MGERIVDRRRRRLLSFDGWRRYVTKLTGQGLPDDILQVDVAKVAAEEVVGPDWATEPDHFEVAAGAHGAHGAERRHSTNNGAGRSLREHEKTAADLIEQWNTLKANDVKALNDSLHKLGPLLLSLDTRIIDYAVEDQIEFEDEN
jgi:hypothetical protein